MLAHKSRKKMSLTVRLGLGLFCLFVAAVIEAAEEDAGKVYRKEA